MILPLNLKDKSYDILLERGALDKIGEYLNLNRKVLIVTDNGVPSEYAKKVANACASSVIVTLIQGEESKNFDNYKKLLKVMLDNSFTRADCVVAVGGGVIGDLAGFVASSYMRGVDFYNIPTTLLSQVDSSIGGKVAIDFEGVKNIVGAFYQPKKVVIDSNVLKTLPKRQIINGLIESVKMALCFDEEFFNFTIKTTLTDSEIDEIILRSLKIKKSVVEQDEKESNLRKVLNFGHTIGHAVESVTSPNLLHGECVALGMLCATENQIKDKLLGFYSRLGLQTKVSADKNKMVEFLSHDKKADSEGITFVFAEKEGSFEFRKVSLEYLSNKMEEIL